MLFLYIFLIKNIVFGSIKLYKKNPQKYSQMGKKPNNQNSTPNTGLKKGKIKRKQMFNELQTIHQHKINNQKIEEQNQQGEEIKLEEEDGKIDTKISIGKQKSVEQICEAVNQLMARNKIGVKNAFDVPIVDLFDMINFQKDQTQNSWKTLSSTLQNDYKIYGYRVDAIHSITYSILNTMSRRSVQNQQKAKQQLTHTKKQLHKTQFTDLKNSFLQSLDSQKTHLQHDNNKINISLIQCSMTSDPTLERTKRLFDQPGLKGMLSNNITLDNNLEMKLFSNTKHESYSMKLSQVNEVNIKTIEHPLKVFESMQKIKLDLNKILKVENTDITTNKQLEQIWNNVKKGNFSQWADNKRVYLDVDDPECRQNFDLMIEENSQNQALFENQNKKFIGNYIKMKNPLGSKKVMTNQEMQLDGQRWLNQIDKKFLGIKSNNINNNRIQVQIPKVKPQDDVNFEDEQIYQRDQILRKQTAPKQVYQQVEDRFLTTIRPFNQFKIQKILTLREQPDIILHAIQQQIAAQYEHDNFMQKQIDIKRQMTSIKDIKQNLYDKFSEGKKSSFCQIYNSYCNTEQQISPALCFLTLLHLANQKNLHFQSMDAETDFQIKTTSN